MRIPLLFLCIIVAGSQSIAAYMQFRSPDALWFTDAFDELVQNCSGRYTEAMARRFSATDAKLLAMSQADLRPALPKVLQRYRDLDEGVKTCASVFLYSLSRRQDSAELLGPHLDAVSELFESSEERLQGTAVVVLGGLQPRPPDEAITRLVNYLQEPTASPRIQTMAVSYVMRSAPERADALNALRSLVAKPLSAEAKIATLFGLAANPGLRDRQLTAFIIAGLDDPREDVRLASCEVLRAFGTPLLLKAESRLRQLTKDSNESGRVRQAAESALKALETR
jgi:hypothetical protein